MTTTTLSSDARSAVGSACAEVWDATAADAVDGVGPELVARPADTAQVGEVMKAASAHGLRVVPRGRGTKLSWGAPPSSVDLVVDLSAMDRVLDHAAGDLIVETQAGATLAAVQDVVRGEGQRLVVDETVPGASVGGTMATNTSGPRRLLVGTARDLLIGVTVVRADGVVAHAGGRVVKNVAGYDLGKLLIGSFGTLGVVTEALFRLHPAPEVEQWVEIEVADADAAQAAAQAVVHSQVVPHAVEVDLPAAGPGRVQVLLGGREAGCTARAETTAGLLGDWARVLGEAPDGFGAYPWTAPTSGARTALKLTCRLSAVGDVLTAARAAGAHVRGSAGTGVLYASLDAPPDEVAAALGSLRAVTHAAGGAAVVVDAPTGVKAAVDVWGPVPGGEAGLDLMRRVKDRFDPDHRLAPGRFVGGI